MHEVKKRVVHMYVCTHAHACTHTGPADENQLKISLADLLMADQQGM